jgi:hypothetical protein
MWNAGLQECFGNPASHYIFRNAGVPLGRHPTHNPANTAKSKFALKSIGYVAGLLKTQSCKFATQSCKFGRNENDYTHNRHVA